MIHAEDSARRLLGSLAAFALLLYGCSSGKDGGGNSAGGGAGGGAGGTTIMGGAGGVSTGGSSATTGASATGGIGAGGSGSGGGIAAGGTTSSGRGGTPTGGTAAGGTAGTTRTGGAGAGGAGTGGTTSFATGGTTARGAGGAGSGGAATGGTGAAVATGGSKGGGGSGGAATGGTASPATGGAMTGGTAGMGSGGAQGSGGNSGVKLVGFATLNGGTKGGLGGETVTATTYAQLKSYAESSTIYIIMVQGTLSNGAAGGQIKVKSNKSIIGVGSTAFLSGIGLDINSASNIIIQNLRMSLVGVTTPSGVNGGDVIGISGTSKNVWIDHCEIFSENPEVQTDIDKYDGLIDIKAQTGFITISWCYLHDHHKGGLVGAADDDLHADRKITYHHNYYNKVKLRIPMYRGAVGHFFNNYVVGAQDATEIRADTCVRVEKNYYEALHYSIYTPSDAPGKTERIDNVEVSRTSRAYPENCTADIPYTYSDVLTTTTNDVKTVVPQSAGVGKI
jgi:pectate lyase